MIAPICTTCGTQYSPSGTPLAACAICADDRQYVNPLGQAWTSLQAMRRTHFSAFRQHEPDLIGIGTMPVFAIGQRALLIRLPSGNVLWDCVSFIDDATVAIVNALGGIRAIAISHPHYYASMVEWADAFGATVFLHAADREWVMRPDPRIMFWSEPVHAVAPGVTLIQSGGHYAGGTVLHWAAGAEGRGALLSGDIFQVGPDRKISFMRSYPNLIPLDAVSVRAVAATVGPFAFDRIYGAWWDRVIPSGGKQAVAEGTARYLRAVSGPPE